MKKFWTVFDKLVDAMATLAWIMLLFLCAALCYTVGMRFLFTRTTIWIAQATEYALLWIVFLSTTWLLREKRACHHRPHLRTSERENAAGA
jgi:TRAP-type C4-dicarboxylate transport system permease small subunit